MATIHTTESIASHRDAISIDTASIIPAASSQKPNGLVPNATKIYPKVETMCAPETRMNGPSDMSEQRLVELMRQFTLEELESELGPRLYNKIYDKVKTELDGPRVNMLSGSTSAAPTPGGCLPVNPKPPSDHAKFQATVEEDTEQDPDERSYFGLKNRANPPQRNPQSCGASAMSATPSPPASIDSESDSSRVSPKSSRRNSNNRSISPEKGARTAGDSRRSSPKARPVVRFSDRPPVVLHGRPAPVIPGQALGNHTPRLPILNSEGHDIEFSPVDNKWGKLFDSEGKPTVRLGQLLRGIANYLITEYSEDSMVLTPKTMESFYRSYRLDDDMFSFRQIFDCGSSRTDLSRLELLYQDLRCRYHLVPRKDRVGSSPYIPALTPAGFEDWMTCHILSCPDQESKRLGLILAKLPITADGTDSEGKLERLPKQLSRHLLPESRDKNIHAIVSDAVESRLRYHESPRRSSKEEGGRRSTRNPRKESGRHKDDDRRGDRESSRRRRRSREGRRIEYSDRDQGSHRDRERRPSSKEQSNPLFPRVSSDGNIYAMHDTSAPSTGSRQHSPHSPVVSNPHRHSFSSTGGLDTSSDEKHPVASAVPARSANTSAPLARSPYRSERRNREQEYRLYQGREPRSTLESSSRSFGHGSGMYTGAYGSGRRASFTLESTPRSEASGSTYGEWARTSPRTSQNTSIEPNGSFHPS